MNFYFFGMIFISVSITMSHGVERDHFNEDSHVIQLNDTMFDNVTHIGCMDNTNDILYLELGNFTRPWFIMFYATWCPHCKRIITLWEQVAEKYQESINVGALEWYTII